MKNEKPLDLDSLRHGVHSTVEGVLDLIDNILRVESMVNSVGMKPADALKSIRQQILDVDWYETALEGCNEG